MRLSQLVDPGRQHRRRIQHQQHQRGSHRSGNYFYFVFVHQTLNQNYSFLHCIYWFSIFSTLNQIKNKNCFIQNCFNFNFSDSELFRVRVAVPQPVHPLVVDQRRIQARVSRTHVGHLTGNIYNFKLTIFIITAF